MSGQDGGEKLDETIADKVGFRKFGTFINGCGKKLIQYLSSNDRIGVA